MKKYKSVFKEGLKDKDVITIPEKSKNPFKKYIYDGKVKIEAILRAGNKYSVIYDGKDIGGLYILKSKDDAISIFDAILKQI